MFWKKKSLIGILTPDECRAVSDDYNKVMDCSWYLIASTDKHHGMMEVFWDYYSWLPSKNGERFSHRLHVNIRNKDRLTVYDFDRSYGIISPDHEIALRFVERVVGFQFTLPLTVPMKWLSFPDGSSHLIWSYYLDIFGMRVVYMYAPVPHVSDDIYNLELERMENQNDIDLVKTPFHRVKWNSDYVPGDTGEPDKN